MGTGSGARHPPRDSATPRRPYRSGPVRPPSLQGGRPVQVVSGGPALLTREDRTTTRTHVLLQDRGAGKGDGESHRALAARNVKIQRAEDC